MQIWSIFGSVFQNCGFSILVSCVVTDGGFYGFSGFAIAGFRPRCSRPKTTRPYKAKIPFKQRSALFLEEWMTSLIACLFSSPVIWVVTATKQIMNRMKSRLKITSLSERVFLKYYTTGKIFCGLES